MSAKDELISHLQTGATTTCRTWAVTRQDGKVYGFTDHDLDLEFEGITFKANSGLTAGALQQTTGFAVDNTEVVGSLSDEAISETDLMAGRFDGAEVVTWMVNWKNTDQRSIRFRGSIGEIRLSNGKFQAELRGLTEMLNHASGRVYQPSCPAVLGDEECRIDLGLPAYSIETTIKRIDASREYFVPSQPGFPDRWFEMGRIRIQTGKAEGMVSVVRLDKEQDGFRRLELMTEFNLAPDVGDTVLLHTGCDKMATTCRAKFNNFLNFRGFPHVPSSDWMASYPVANQVNDGGSRHK